MKQLASGIFTIIIFLLIKCGPEVIDADLPNESKKICISGTVLPDSAWSIFVTYSRSMVGDGPYFEFTDIPDASVTILEDGIKLATLTRIPTDPQQYLVNHPYESGKTPSYVPKIGKKYDLQVNVPGIGTATSSCQIPIPVPIERLELNENPQIIEVHTINYTPTTFSEPVIPVTVYFRDPLNTENYYQLASRVTFLDPTNFYTYGKTIEWPLLTDDDRFYNPVNPSSGTIVPKKPPYRPVMFGDDGINGTLVKVKCYAEIGNLYTPDSKKYIFEIVLYTLNKDYYQFNANKDLQSSTKENPFAQPVIVHTNIQNGFGIFAGYSKSVVPLK